jgi:hypothetical protein
MHKRNMIWTAVFVLASAVWAIAGPAWVEGGGEGDDAGPLPESAEVTVGDGPMFTISGSLDGDAAATGLPDFEDMYLIQIADPANFSATTAFLPGFTEFDSRLYLFEYEGIMGLGLLGNEDTGGGLPGVFGFFGDILTGACCLPDGTCQDLTLEDCFVAGGDFQGIGSDCKGTDCIEQYGACCYGDSCYEDYYSACVDEGGIFLGDGTVCEGEICPNPEGSTMGNSSNDVFPPTVITEPGLYLIAITVTPREPVSQDGAMFFFMDPDEVSSADGPGGAFPIMDWQAPVPAFSLPLPGFHRAVDVPGEYTILFNGVGFAEASELELPLDIKPGACPNPLNRKSKGKLPVSILGTMDFDVSTIDISSLQMARADGVGGTVTPNEGPPGPHTVIEDTGTPFEGEPCDCGDLGEDGINDLSMKFKTPQIVAAFELNDLPGGAVVEFVVSGTLLDGTPFTARDCISIVPPQ